jgi:hypothetical protein
MDIFELRARARREGLARRQEIRDPVWERGPVGIVVRRDVTGPVDVSIEVSPCRDCGDRRCRC